MSKPLQNETPEQVQPLDFRTVGQFSPSPQKTRLSALDLARGIAILLMVISHSIKGLLTFEQMPAWGIMPIHTLTKFSSSLFFLVFGVSLSLFFLPYTDSPTWSKKRNQLLWRSLQLMVAYKVLTVIQMYNTYSTEFIVDTLLFKKFPDFVEVLGFYSFALLWLPFFLPVWRHLPLLSKIAVIIGMAIGGHILNVSWDFAGYTSIKAILVEERGYFTFGQMQRGALVLFGVLLGDFFTYFRGNAYREKYMALFLMALGTLTLVYFYYSNQSDLYNTLYNIGKNQGKHPPTEVFMAFSVGGAMVILGVIFLFSKWLPRLLAPITVVGQAPLFSFCFHIVIVFVFYRDLYGLHHKTNYEFAWVLTGFLIAMTIASAAAVVRVRNDKSKARSRTPLPFGLFLICMLAYGQTSQAQDQSVSTLWNQKLQTRMVNIQKKFNGEIGLFVKDLSSGLTYSMNADTQWYLASTIKVFVLIEVMRKVELGELILKDTFQIQKSHYRDGSGQTNWIPAGKNTTLQFLIEQMMIESDNAATDILIDLVGLDELNKNIREYAPTGFNPIISLLSVRHLAYGELHPKAKELTNLHFLKLKRSKSEPAKLKKLGELVGVDPKNFKVRTLNEAFERFYEKGYNSSTLVAFAGVLERLARGQIINEARSKEILALMKRCYTGKSRIVAKLPVGYSFAHKTGTQYRRACDMGVLTVGANSKQVVITACTQKFKTLTESDAIFQKIGEAVKDSGIMTAP